MSIYGETLDAGRNCDLPIRNRKDILKAMESALTLLGNVSKSSIKLNKALDKDMSRSLVERNKKDSTVIGLVYKYLAGYSFDSTLEFAKALGTLRGLILEETLIQTLTAHKAASIERQSGIIGTRADAIAFLDGSEGMFMVYKGKGKFEYEQLSPGVNIFEAKAGDRLGYISGNDHKFIRHDRLFKQVIQGAVACGKGRSIVAVRMDTSIDDEVYEEINNDGGKIILLPETNHTMGKKIGEIRKRFNKHN